jgi:hypothetical protein
MLAGSWLPQSMALSFGAFVQITVEHWEADEEGQADQILDPFDVLVEVNQGVNLMPLADLIQQVHVRVSFAFVRA